MLESQFLAYAVVRDTGFALFGQAVAPKPPSWQEMLFNPMSMITILIVLFYVMVLLPERRNRKVLAERLTALKKNDRVVTVGGIHGTIVSTSDSDQVVVRIDENNNTRVHVNRSAISRVISDDSEKK